MSFFAVCLHTHAEVVKYYHLFKENTPRGNTTMHKTCSEVKPLVVTEVLVHFTTITLITAKISQMVLIKSFHTFAYVGKNNHETAVPSWLWKYLLLPHSLIVINEMKTMKHLHMLLTFLTVTPLLGRQWQADLLTVVFDDILFGILLRVLVQVPQCGICTDTGAGIGAPLHFSHFTLLCCHMWTIFC